MSISAIPEPVDDATAVLSRRMRRASSIAELFVLLAAAGREQLGFERGLVLGAWKGQLDATQTGPCDDADSDELRRHVLRHPVATRPGTAEAHLLSKPGATQVRGQLPSDLVSSLGLEHYVLAAVAPGDDALAVLVLDRADRPVHASELVGARVLVELAASALECQILRLRTEELAGELRLMASSARTLSVELLQAPLVLPRDQGVGLAFPPVGLVDEPDSDRIPGCLSDRDVVLDRARGVLSEREVSVALMLVEGRSNRDIADQLHLSTETVKSHISRISRKLEATNRVEAATKFLRLVHA